MGEVKTLLTYMADVAVTVRGHPFPGTQENGSLGPTVTELASEDRTLYLLLRAHQSLQSALRHRGGRLSLIAYYKNPVSLERSGLLVLLGDGLSSKGQVVTMMLIACDG